MSQEDCTRVQHHRPCVRVYDQGIMKFAQQYATLLRQEGYPEAWTRIAISYRLLKKCIKKVQEELASLGVDVGSPNQTSTESTSAQNRLLKTVYENDAADPVLKIIFAVDSEGLPLDAKLSPDIRSKLQDVAKTAQAPQPTRASLSSGQRALEGELNTYSDNQHTLHGAVTEVEVPIHNAKDFFHTLCVEVEGLGTMRGKQINEIKERITNLSELISTVAVPPETGKARNTDLYAWRQVFSMYNGCEVFVANREQDRSTHGSIAAQKQFQEFSQMITDSKVLKRFKRRASRQALEQFVGINAQLLDNLKFRELNLTAMTKILKKLSKRTTIVTWPVRSRLIAAEPFSSERLAKDLGSQMARDLVSIVPQPESRLCPVCLELRWKPLRLRCQHIVCVRCVLLLQREHDKHCPFCRAETIMELDKRTNVFLTALTQQVLIVDRTSRLSGNAISQAMVPQGYCKDPERT